MGTITKECEKCLDTGKFAVQDGPDDYRWETCDCKTDDMDDDSDKDVELEQDLAGRELDKLADNPFN